MRKLKRKIRISLPKKQSLVRELPTPPELGGSLVAIRHCVRIYRKAAVKFSELSADQVRDVVHNHILETYGVTSAKMLTRSQYEELVTGWLGAKRLKFIPD